MPMSLMPLSDDEKNGVLIYSTGYRKEIVGKMDDFKMNAGFLNNRVSSAPTEEIMKSLLID